VTLDVILKQFLLTNGPRNVDTIGILVSHCYVLSLC